MLPQCRGLRAEPAGGQQTYENLHFQNGVGAGAGPAEQCHCNNRCKVAPLTQSDGAGTGKQHSPLGVFFK